eukprot:CAMPEP_0183590592 /NCGR_PEP_ID=MMETSP0371-20130417/164802_1 /TAXON_ID=268820 /ORGANISM="Peridinium aciculiferum, Strain PAER-2" /LENGTH=43 /DNA_ID= /DNA_START= /DNA_END= /DNA_ORIENTATION=
MAPIKAPPTEAPSEVRRLMMKMILPMDVANEMTFIAAVLDTNE